MSEWSQDLARTQNVDWVFLLSTTFPTSGVITQSIIYKCLLKVLGPVRRPITTLDFVLSKDKQNYLIWIGDLKLSEKKYIYNKQLNTLLY